MSLDIIRSVHVPSIRTVRAGTKESPITHSARCLKKRGKRRSTQRSPHDGFYTTRVQPSRRAFRDRLDCGKCSTKARAAAQTLITTRRTPQMKHGHQGPLALNFPINQPQRRQQPSHLTKPPQPARFLLDTPFLLTSAAYAPTCSHIRHCSRIPWCSSCMSSWLPGKGSRRCSRMDSRKRTRSLYA